MSGCTHAGQGSLYGASREGRRHGHCGWLRSLGLEKYEAAFRENEIDETVLPDLTAEDLKELGVSLVGHRRKLLQAIAALRTDAGVKAPSASEATAPTATSVPPEDCAERR
jgi:SAM domain (Sterile alpha motif)